MTRTPTIGSRSSFGPSGSSSRGSSISRYGYTPGSSRAVRDTSPTTGTYDYGRYAGRYLSRDYPPASGRADDPAGSAGGATSTDPYGMPPANSTPSGVAPGAGGPSSIPVRDTSPLDSSNTPVIFDDVSLPRRVRVPRMASSGDQRAPAAGRLDRRSSQSSRARPDSGFTMSSEGVSRTSILDRYRGPERTDTTLPDAGSDSRASGANGANTGSRTRINPRSVSVTSMDTATRAVPVLKRDPAPVATGSGPRSTAPASPIGRTDTTTSGRSLRRVGETRSITRRPDGPARRGYDRFRDAARNDPDTGRRAAAAGRAIGTVTDAGLRTSLDVVTTTLGAGNLGLGARMTRRGANGAVVGTDPTNVGSIDPVGARPQPGGYAGCGYGGYYGFGYGGCGYGYGCGGWGWGRSYWCGSSWWYGLGWVWGTCCNFWYYPYRYYWGYGYGYYGYGYGYGSYYPYYTRPVLVYPEPVYSAVVYEQYYPPEEEVIYEEGAPAAAPQEGEGTIIVPPKKEDDTDAFLNPTATHYLTLGDHAFKEGRYGDAVHYYAKAVEFAPGNGTLYLILSDSLFATGDYHYAAYALRQALELDPDLAQASVDKHSFYDDPSEFDKQLSTLERYLEDHFIDDDARLLLGANYLFGNRNADAIKLLESPFSSNVRESQAGAVLLEAARTAHYR